LNTKIDSDSDVKATLALNSVVAAEKSAVEGDGQDGTGTRAANADVVGRVESVELSDGGANFGRKVLVCAVGEVVWLNNALTGSALRDLEGGASGKDSPGVTEATSFIRNLRCERIDGNVELGQGDLGNGVVGDGGVGVGTANDTVGEGLVVLKQTAGVVGLADLLWDKDIKSGGQAVGVRQLVVAGNIAGSNAGLVGDGEDIVIIENGV